MFFDIGANIGKWSLNNIKYTDKIIAVEASPSTFIKLQKLCNDKNIILLNYAVCNNDGKDITFYNCNCDVLSTLNRDWLTDKKSRFYNNKYNEVICKTITIDNLIKNYGVPELIKIDVEGGEYECIKSLTIKVNQICFEWASETNDITFKCLNYLKELGFKEFYVQNEDNYLFRPNENEYYDIDNTFKILNNSTPKVDWGMIWCK